ncbi:MAG TPA: signaling protein [Janthinobacterium sp.]|nr:signaling protein [Janthinobacterium sp.]
MTRTRRSESAPLAALVGGRRGIGAVRNMPPSVPLFALLLLVAIWAATFHLIDVERAGALLTARESNRELIDTYEAQMARSLAGIDQTLKVIKYVVEQKGAAAALPALKAQGLLPPALVFAVKVTDRDGLVVASHPPARAMRVAAQSYFRYHVEHDGDAPYVSRTLADAAGPDWHLHFTRRLNDGAGRFAGIASIEVDPAYFTSGYERSRLGEAGMLGLLGSDGVFRAMRVGDKVSWGQGASPAPGDSLGVNPWDGVRRYTAVRALHGFPLSAVVGQAESEQMAAFERHRLSYLWEAGAASALLLLLASLAGAWSWQFAKTRRHILRAQETYAAASEASLDAFFVLRGLCDSRGRIIDFAIDATNGPAENMLGMRKRALRGMSLCALLPDCRRNGLFDSLLKVTLEGGVHEQEWQAALPASRARWLHRQVVGVKGGAVAIVRDITERKRAEDKIRHMAHHDALTGLPNRGLICDLLEQAILRAQRDGSGVAVAFIDLDSFKLVNDGLGHNAGNELLKIVGERMGRCVRRADTVGRLSGDEFLIVLSDQRDGAAVAPLLEKIRAAVNIPIVLDGQEVQVGCSMGVALFPRDGADPNTLLLNADAAMYRAKARGRNNVQFYTSEMNACVEEKLALLEGLRHALDDDQFRLLYQPKVDLRDGRVFGVEALVRWQHPEHGMISPLRFIPLAEDSGMIVAIGEWVLRTACRQNMAWQAAGLAPVTMSVNVSPRQFEEKRLVERVAQALCESGMAAAELELEVTESLIMRDMPLAVGKMREIREMGVALSIDDFGTGHSSLWALKSFPISRLKIDKSFVRDLAENGDDQAIAMAIISLGHKLNLRIIAEGVETEQQRSFLRDNDCDEMQGYLFSRPVTADEIAALLAAQAA